MQPETDSNTAPARVSVRAGHPNQALASCVAILIVFGCCALFNVRAHALQSTQTAVGQTATSAPSNTPTLPPVRQRSGLDIAKAGVEIAKDLCTIAAMLVGGFWTWMLFVRKRENYPRATLKHRISQISLTPSVYLLRVTLEIANTGNVMLKTMKDESWTAVQQIVPAPESLLDRLNSGGDPLPSGQSEYEWPWVGWQRKIPEFELEPGESDEITSEFFMDNKVRIVSIYSYVPNKTKRPNEIGWRTTTIYDLEKRSATIYGQASSAMGAAK